MELTQFIQDELDRQMRSMNRTLETLNNQEIMWRPGPEANSIGVILFHMARSEDTFVQSRLRNQPQTWETGKWYEKFNCPVTETGAGYTREQVCAFVLPDMKVLMDYTAAVRAETIRYVNALTPAKFDEVIDMGRIGKVSIGSVFSLIVLHMAGHTGEISYIRGLQRGMNK